MDPYRHRRAAVSGLVSTVATALAFSTITLILFNGIIRAGAGAVSTAVLSFAG